MSFYSESVTNAHLAAQEESEGHGILANSACSSSCALLSRAAYRITSCCPPSPLIPGGPLSPYGAYTRGRPRFFGFLQRWMWRFLFGPGNRALQLGQGAARYLWDFFRATRMYYSSPGIPYFQSGASHRGFRFSTHCFRSHSWRPTALSSRSSASWVCVFFGFFRFFDFIKRVLPIKLLHLKVPYFN